MWKYRWNVNPIKRFKSSECRNAIISRYNEAATRKLSKYNTKIWNRKRGDKMLTFVTKCRGWRISPWVNKRVNIHLCWVKSWIIELKQWFGSLTGIRTKDNKTYNF
jgi:hypothetical protein